MKAKCLVKYVLLVGLIPGSVHAAATVCEGTVDQLSYHAENSFMLKLTSMNTAVMFCNPDAVWAVAGTPYKTGTETCKMLYSTFLSAQMSGAKLSAVYFDGDDSNGNCNTFPAWAKVNIRHFILAGK